MTRVATVVWIALLVACASSAPVQAPTPPDVGADPEITRRFEDRDRSLEYWVERFEGESREIAVERRTILDALEVEPGSDVADIGAGTGLFEPLLSGAVGPGGKVYAVDISPRFLDHLRDRKKAEGWSNVTIVEGTETSPQLAPDSVDLVFICATYHHFTHVPDMLAAIKSSLRPGGRMVIVDFHRIPGESSEWVLEHVRVGMKDVIAEIEAAGFRYTRTIEILEENFVLEFERPAT